MRIYDSYIEQLRQLFSDHYSTHRSEFRQPSKYRSEVAKKLQRLESLMGPGRYCVEFLGIERDLSPEALEAKRISALLESVRPALLEIFDSDYLGTNQRKLRFIGKGLPLPLVLNERTHFVQSWCNENGFPGMDPEQSAAVAAVHAHTLVAARAGSGKTRTIVARASFLVQHCKVNPSEILILAFNKKAAEEIKSRLSLKGIHCPHVMTYHALSHAIVRPEENLVADGQDGQVRSRITQRVIDDFVAEGNGEDRVQSVMLRHFRHDWETMSQTGVLKTRDEGLLYRRSLQNEALDGQRVKSYGEKVIANFLFEHDISYRYEKNHWWDKQNYKPDFTLTHHQIVIEYFGMRGDPEYDKEMEGKKNYWSSQDDWSLVDLEPGLLQSRDTSGFQAELARRLEQLGLQLNRLSEDEIWLKIKKRILTRFAQILTSLVGRCRKAMLTPEALEQRLQTHQFCSEIESDVLQILKEIYSAYLVRLKAEGSEDFDGLVWRAAESVEAGRTQFIRRESGAGDLANMRFVMVDEYQDQSPLFQRLLEAIVNQADESCQIFSVGDDWQSINSFAGSDLHFFREYESIFTQSDKLHLSTNYRSRREIVEFCNQIMNGFGKPAKHNLDADPADVFRLDLSEFSPSTPEHLAWPYDSVTPCLRRLIREPLQAGKSIAVLARMKYLPHEVSDRTKTSENDGLAKLRGNLTEGLPDSHQEQLHVGTVHGFKGREADTVIVLDALERYFPKVHPDWVFGRVFGDELEKLVDEERRLFYVACSRAVEQLVLITDSSAESPFLCPENNAVPAHEKPHPSLKFLDIKSYEAFCPSGGDWILMLGNADGFGNKPTIQRANLIKGSGYKYHGIDWPHWSKSIPKEYAIDQILEQLPCKSWVKGPDGLEVRICQSDGVVVKRGVIIGGCLEEIAALL